MWLLGLESLNPLNENNVKKDKNESENNITLFNDSGYAQFKTNRNKLLFITGTQNRTYLHCGHKHIDMLSFTF